MSRLIHVNDLRNRIQTVDFGELRTPILQMIDSVIRDTPTAFDGEYIKSEQINKMIVEIKEFRDETHCLHFIDRPDIVTECLKIIKKYTGVRI